MLIHDDEDRPQPKRFSKATPKQYGWRLVLLGAVLFAAMALLDLPAMFGYPAFAAVCIGFVLILGERRK